MNETAQVGGGMPPASAPSVAPAPDMQAAPVVAPVVAPPVAPSYSAGGPTGATPSSGGFFDFIKEINVIELSFMLSV